NHRDMITVEDFIQVRHDQPTKVFLPRLLMSMVALVFVMVLSFYVYLFVTPVTTLTIDINPSLIVTLNTFDRVVEVKGVDSESEAFISGLKLKNRTVGDFMQIILDEAVIDQYSSGEEGYWLIGIYGENLDSEENLQQLIPNNDSLTTLTILQHGFTSFSLENITFKSEVATGELDSAPENNTDWPIDQGSDIGDLNPAMDTITVSDSELYAIAENEGISQTKLVVAIDIFNRSDDYTTESDFTELISMDIETLIQIYTSLQ
ncbi:MAG TPA: hypothetical protein PKU69_03345, partial [Bacillota bacterium]|nr:hypothetical protein [Bacillota bacterium]